MLNDLLLHLETVTVLSTSFKDFLRERLIERTIAADEYLLQPAQQCDRVVFLGNGMMHAYRKVFGHRVTCRFYRPGNLCIDPTSFFTHAPSLEYIAPVSTDCTIFELDVIAQAEVRKFPEWVKLWQKFLIDAILTNEQLLFMFRTMNARERYEWVNRQYPDLEQSTRKRQFASWIGMAAVTVYEILKQDRRTIKRKQ